MVGKAIFVQTTARSCFCVQICFSDQTLKSLEKTELTRIRFNSVLFGCTSANLIELFSYKWSIGVILSL